MLRATLGEVTFELAGACRLLVPAVEAQASLSFAELDAALVLTGPGAVLVIDHRREPQPDTPVRVELWRQAGPCETPVELLVLADSVQPDDSHAPANVRGRIERLVVRIAENNAATPLADPVAF